MGKECAESLRWYFCLWKRKLSRVKWMGTWNGKLQIWNYKLLSAEKEVFWQNVGNDAQGLLCVLPRYVCSLPYLGTRANCFRALSNINRSYWWHCWSWEAKQLSRLGSEPSQDWPTDWCPPAQEQPTHTGGGGRCFLPSLSQCWRECCQVDQFCLLLAGQSPAIELASSTSKTEKADCNPNSFF